MEDTIFSYFFLFNKTYGVQLRVSGQVCDMMIIRALYGLLTFSCPPIMVDHHQMIKKTSPTTFETVKKRREGGRRGGLIPLSVSREIPHLNIRLALTN